MMKTQFIQSILERDTRLALLIGVYAGLQITGANIRQAVTNASAQTEAVLAMHTRFGTEALLTAMDLSAEAEAFGCPVQINDDEIPSVTGKLVADLDQASRLKIPTVGTSRTAVHLAVAKALTMQRTAPVLGGCIGPFSLSALLMGVNEALQATITNPDILHTLLEKTSMFIINYMLAFREAGAVGVIMAEPTAGLLSPLGVGQFSSQYVKRIVDAVQRDDFTLLYHNCGARNVHLPKVLESGASIYHFNNQMDIAAALQVVDASIVLGGNIDPTGVFRFGTAEDVRNSTQSLLQATKKYQNFFIASGCDLPPGIPVENMDMFYQTVSRFK